MNSTVVGTLLVTVLVLTFTPAQAGGDELTPAAAAAVKELFPDASVMGVGQEREGGVLYYEVVVRNGGERIEIEVTADGAIGEVESEMALADAPDAVRAGIARHTDGAEVAYVERTEIRGVPSGDSFAPLDPPVIAYEVEFELDGRRREIAIGADGKLLGQEEEDDDSDDEEDDEAPDSRAGAQA